MKLIDRNEQCNIIVLVNYTGENKNILTAYHLFSHTKL